MKILIILSLLTLSFLAPIEDLTHLPDYPLNNTLYSGYLNASEYNLFFYVYAPSQTSPKDDPLVLWLNGGPGCSSLIGFATENGPAVFKGNETNFTVNPYSWNLVANMLYIESPATVGYNIGNNSGHLENDASTAEQNLQAVISFFKKFPELKSKEFYVTGESYGGIYVPELANNIVEYNKHADLEDYINLVGIAVGNGVTDGDFYRLGYYGNLKFVNLDLVPYPAVKNFLDCGINPNCSIDTFNYFLNFSLSDINPYFLLQSNVNTDQPHQYYNRPDVKKAFRVPQDIEWFSCGGEYTGNAKAESLPVYPNLIENKIRILIYSGDADSIVPTDYTRNWIRKLNLTRVEGEYWRVWRDDDDEVLGGFLTEYKENFTFITVHGSGHQVPQFKPRLAFHFIKNYLNNQKI